MGSPLAPILANLFMGFHESNWISECEPSFKPLYYKRYVDDVFAIFSNEEQSEIFFRYLNNKHPNIKFTLEKEENGKLSFLDIFIEKQNDSPNFKTSIFRKKTFSGLLLNFFSFTCFSYKKGLIKTLIDRVYKINNTWSGFHDDILHIKTILQKNNYPISLIDKTINFYLKSKHEKIEDERTENEKKDRFFKLPYIGKYSDLVKKKLTNLCKNIAKTII